MKTIKLLDDLTINQIAAGEVIEGPSSVVKELVENSIDAKATRIEIEVKNGGKTYIRVTDNGKGIDYDDIDIAFERHATSKLRSSEDLSKVLTMGFRGEALASISSVADVTLTSKKENATTGYTYRVKGNETGKIEEKECSKGTNIVVKDLFFNVPVRYKFLKNDNSELQKIKKVLIRQALSNLDVSFKLINSGKTVLKTSGNSKMQDAVYEIFGKDVANNLIDVDYTYQNLNIKGIVGSSRVEMPYRKNEIFFVNNRSIENDILASGAEQAFKGALKIGKFPFVILNAKIPTQLVYMNIHPTKKEIKFQNEDDVFKLVYQGVKDALLKEEFLGRNETRNSESIREDYVKKQESYLPESFSIQVDNSSEKNKIKSNSVDLKNNMNFENPLLKRIQNAKNISAEASAEIKKELAKENKKLEYKYIGVVFKTFIMIDISGELYFVDQHAAHERVLYEQVKDSYNSGKDPETQMLIIPTILPLKRSEVELVKDNIEVFKKVGFQIEDFGNDTIKISGVPNIAYSLDSATIFQDTLKELTSYARTSKQEIENKFIATVACKAAVKAGMVLTFKEIDTLLQELFSLPNPYTCPHGRPTTIKYTQEELERLKGKNL